MATAQDKAKSGAEDIDMFRNLNFSLKNSFNILIKSNILNFSAKDFSNITNTCEITLYYAYSDIITKSLSIVVSQNSETYNSSISANYPYFQYQNKLYEECWLDQNNVTKLNENISTIKNAKIDGEEYSVTVETGKISYNLYNKYLKDQLNIPAIYLPSPSSANANYSLDLLIKEYKIILNFLK